MGRWRKIDNRIIYSPSKKERAIASKWSLQLGLINYLISRCPCGARVYSHAYVPGNGVGSYLQSLARFNVRDHHVVYMCDIQKCFDSISRLHAYAALYFTAVSLRMAENYYFDKRDTLHPMQRAVLEGFFNRKENLNFIDPVVAAYVVYRLTPPCPFYFNRKILAQGLPTSPFLANIVLYFFVDFFILNLGLRHRWPNMMACINPTNLLQGFLKPYVKLYSKHQRDVFAYVCEGEEYPDIQYARYSDNFVICVHEDKVPVVRQLFDVLAKYGLRVRSTTYRRGDTVKACGFNWVIGERVYPTRAQKRRLRALTYIKNKYNDMLPVHAGVSGWVHCLNHAPRINPTRSTLASVLATYQVAGSESYNDSIILP